MYIIHGQKRCVFSIRACAPIKTMEDLANDLRDKAARYIADAEKTLKRPTFWGVLEGWRPGLWGAPLRATARVIRSYADNYEDAAHAYHQAANTYKFLKDWELAYRYYMAAAKYTAGNVEIGNLDQVTDATKSATLLVVTQAADALEHFDRPKAVKLYTTIANIYITLNNYDKAANTTAYTALMMRTLGDPAAAIAAYRLAAEYYAIVANPPRFKILDCWENMAKIYIEQAGATHAPADPFVYAREACDLYKQIALKHMADATTMVSFRIYEPLFKSLVCMFYCDDPVAIRNRYLDYCRMYPAFETINDGVFLGKLIKLVERAGDGTETAVAEYQAACRERDMSKPLEGWMVGALLYQLEKGISACACAGADGGEVDLS